MPGKLMVPAFANEAEEAQWWFDHRDELTGAFEDAAAKGELHRSMVATRARDAAEGTGVSPATTTIRLDPEDASRAHALAAKRGLGYQAYLKMLLHDALETEEKRLAG